MRPLWLATPTRFANFPRRRALVALALLAILLALSLTALRVPGPPPASQETTRRGDDKADVVLYETIIDGVRHGGDYYPVTADALRLGNYPLRPFVTFRLPTLAMVQAYLPPVIVIGLLYLLAAATLLAWNVRLRPIFARAPPRFIALALLAGGMAMFVQAELAVFHEIWAGLLIALSLALWRRDRWIESVALGLAAMLIRETAALYALVMCLAAARERRWTEASAWIGAVAVLALAVTAHAHAVAQVVRPLDPHSPGWTGMLGFGFFVKTMTLSTALAMFPPVVAALVVALSLFGWAAWCAGTGLRTLATLLIYAALLALAGRTDTFYWGLLVAPLSLLGLAFAPDGLRDLIVAAHRRRRVTVTRKPA